MLKMHVLGDPQKVDSFMRDLKTRPQYQVIAESQIFDECRNQEAIAFATFDITQKIRKPVILQLTTSNKKELVLDLRDAQFVKSDNGVTWIKGKVNDIYW